MARAIRWQCAFRSKDNIPCTVSVYEEGWTGGITQLIPAPNPFYYEEDNSEDMTSFVRPRTGYLSVVEQTYGELNDLFTTSALQHYVTFEYNGILDFTGYLQIQTFQNKIDPGPHVLDFPVVSVLGLLDSFSFEAPANNALPATNIKIGALLKELWNTMQASWSRVVAPYLATSEFFVGHETSRLVCCPFNKDYDRSEWQTTPMFSPITFADFMEGLCASYGYMVYETPTELIFRMPSRTDSYAYVNKGVIDAVDGNNTWVNPIASPTGSTVYPIADKYEWIDNEATIENIMPVREMSTEFEGEFLSDVSFSMDRMKATHLVFPPQNIVFMHSESPELIDAGHLLTGNTLYGGSGRQFTEYGAWPMAYSYLGEKHEAIFIQPSTEWSNVSLFSMVFYKRPSAKNFLLNVDCRWGDDYRDQYNDHDQSDSNRVLCSIMGANGKFYNNNPDTPVWQNTEVFYLPNSLIGGVFIQNAPEGPITLHFKLQYYQSSTMKKLLSIWDVNLSVQEEPLAEFRYDMNAPAPTLSNKGGEEKVTISRKFVVGGKRNENMAIGAYEISINPIYALYSQQRMVARYRKLDKLGDTTYRPLLAYMKDAQNVLWRQLAQRFTPVDDEMELTLQRVLPDNS